ncbi:MAG: hypothetical protein WDA29_10955 [Flavobacteriaceae bacterium]
MDTTTNTSRPATAAEAIAILLPEDDGLPITRDGLEALLAAARGKAAHFEDQMRRPAMVLSGPAMPRVIRRALADLDLLGAQYKAARDLERRAELKLRAVKQIEELYASK